MAETLQYGVFIGERLIQTWNGDEAGLRHAMRQAERANGTIKVRYVTYGPWAESNYA